MRRGLYRLAGRNLRASSECRIGAGWEAYPAGTDANACSGPRHRWAGEPAQSRKQRPDRYRATFSSAGDFARLAPMWTNLLPGRMRPGTSTAVIPLAGLREGDQPLAALVPEL
jgi:hypothetical protein